MMQGLARQAVAWVFLALALSSCRPASYEQFVRSNQARGGEYLFELDMSDSSATYDVSLYTRADAPLMTSERPDSQMALSVRWFAPSDSAALAETVFLPCGGAAGSVQLYRSGMRPRPSGTWKVSVRVKDAPEGLRGIGIICKRNSNGTR